MSQTRETQLFDHEKIQGAVKEIAVKVSAWLETERMVSLKVVSILEGARPFTRDLVKQLQTIMPALGIEMVEVRVKGTDGIRLLEARQWEGVIPNSENFKNAWVLLVDDLADSGKTLGMLRDHLRGLGAGDIKTAVLIRKFGMSSGPVDFRGFDLNLDRKSMAEKGLRDYWLFGYGMDFEGGRRDLDHICWIPIGNHF